jgi:hypothetical protein
MDFVCVPGGATAMFKFSIGWAAFANYNPANGKEMFIQAQRMNMAGQDGWNFKLSDPRQQISQMNENVFVARLRGEQSIAASLDVLAPRPEVMGRTLKENLIVPPKAGGRQSNAAIPSGEAPIYVKVSPGSTLLVANYSFHDNDEQFVDLDGQRDLFPPNGPGGVPNAILQRALEQASEFKLLLAPQAPLGALVGSFDNFKTAFLIAEGAQLKVPANAQFLALGINDAIGLFEDNSGPGFRVKVIQRSPGQTGSLLEGLESSLIPVAHAQRPAERVVIPIEEVMPTLCLNGYEKTGAVRTIGGTKHELYRYIGNVCWGFINVFPRDHSEKPDQGDPFDDSVGGAGTGCGGGCGGGRSGGLVIPVLLLSAGLVVIGRYARRR